jgi:hypothetical protein
MRLNIHPNLLVCAAILLSGCSHGEKTIGTGSEVTAADLPPGWRRVKADDASVSLGLAPKWEPFTMQQDTLVKNVSQAEARNGRSVDRSKLVEKFAARNEFKILVRHSLQPGRSFYANGNVMVLPAPAGLTLEAEAKKSEVGLSKGASNVQKIDVKLPIGPTKLIKYEKPFITRTGPITLIHLCFISVQNGHIYLLSYAIPSDETDAEQEAEQMATTWRLAAGE